LKRDRENELIVKRDVEQDRDLEVRNSQSQGFDSGAMGDDVMPFLGDEFIDEIADPK